MVSRSVIERFIHVIVTTIAAYAAAVTMAPVAIAVFVFLTLLTLDAIAQAAGDGER